MSLHLTAKASIVSQATHWHLLPAAPAKAIWQAINPHTGKRRIDEGFPPQWRDTTVEKEMFIRLKWGSIWQIVGSDSLQSLVGTPPEGIVMSE